MYVYICMYIYVYIYIYIYLSLHITYLSLHFTYFTNFIKMDGGNSIVLVTIVRKLPLYLILQLKIQKCFNPEN